MDGGNELYPEPPRFWWLKRLTIAYLLIAALAGLTRWWWGRDADRRMADFVAERRALGEPVLPTDFQSVSPGEDTAGALFLRAAQNIKWTDEGSFLRSVL